MGSKAVFLDRDGTITPETGAREADPDVEPLPESFGAVRTLRRAGFLVVVVTNQSGIARGYYTEAELRGMHDALMHKFAEAGAPIDALYYCPHLPDGEVAEYAVECNCRKPRPGLLLRAAQEHEIDLPASYMVGDTERDIQAGRAAGCKGTALIRPDQRDTFTLDFGAAPQWQQVMQQMKEAVETGANAVVPDVAVAADWILAVEESDGG